MTVFNVFKVILLLITNTTSKEKEERVASTYIKDGMFDRIDLLG